jgi:AcrR family transcriptional regulator
MMAAIIDLVAADGYAATTVGDVIARAGVSRKTFYEHFADKQACFLAAFDEAVGDIAVGVITAVESQKHRDRRILDGYQALCDALAARPAFARIYLIRAAEAGEAVHRRRSQIRAANISNLRTMTAAGRKRHPDLPPELSEPAAQAIVGAVETILAAHIERHGAETLGGLAPTLAAVANALFLADIREPTDGPRIQTSSLISYAT